MMSISCLVFSIFLIAVSAQDCSERPPRVRPSECCPGSPKFMTPALAEECGLPSEMPSENGSGSGGPPQPPSCEATQCILRKNNLLTADNKVDKAAFKTFTESQYSSEWKPAIDKASQICDADTNTSDDCEARRYMLCMRNTMFINCPASIASQSSECTQLRTFMEKCPMPGPPMGGQ